LKTDQLSRLNSLPGDLREGSVVPSKEKLNPAVGPTFGDTLKKVDLGKGQFDLRESLNGIQGLQKSDIKFSNHAVDRMISRGITFSPEQLGKLNEVVDKAAAKGSRDSLVLMGDSALIVSVKNKTVVTVMDKNNMKENVFTNIDSTIVM